MDNKGIIVLICVCIISAIVAYQPHANYPYPLHVDEWFHIAQAQKIAENNLVPIDFDVYTNEKRGYFEVLWHYPLAIFDFIFSPGITIWQFLPALMAALAVLSTYFFARRWGENAGLIAAFLVALIPSNVTIGGLSLLVPVNLSLIIIPVALKVAFDFDLGQKKNLAILFGLTLFLLLAHPPSAVVLLAVLGIYALLSWRDDRKKTKQITVAVVAALLLSIWNYWAALSQKGAGALQFPFWIYLREIPVVYGVVPTIFFVLGFWLFVREGKKEEWAIAGVSVFLIFDIVFFSNTGIGLVVPYQRAFIPLMLFMSVIAANALAKIKPVPALAVILLIILGLGIQSHAATPYYHVVNEKDVEAFAWIKDNTPKDAVVLLDPWKARALTPIAERKVFTVTPFGPKSEEEARNALAIGFLSKKCADSDFLRQNGISVVYAEKGCDNPDLLQEFGQVYVFRG